METIRQLPYFPFFVADFKGYKDGLSEHDFFIIINAVCDFYHLGKKDFKPENPIQKLYFEQIIEKTNKYSKKYFSNVENGKKGGRPKSNPINESPKPKETKERSDSQSDSLFDNDEVKNENNSTNTDSQSKNKPKNQLAFATQDIIDSWNYIATTYNLASIESLNKARLTKLNLRIKECESPDKFFSIVNESIRNSSFLRGDSGKWQCSFDFFLQESSFLKVREGTYNDKEKIDDRSTAAILKHNIKEYEEFLNTTKDTQND